MRFSLLALSLLLSFSAFASPPAGYLSRVADAIYWSEGGTKSSKQYGLVFYKEPNRAACLKHLSSYYSSWEKTSEPDFLAYLASHWAPTTKVGAKEAELNKNWLKNVRWFMKHPKPAP